MTSVPLQINLDEAALDRIVRDRLLTTIESLSARMRVDSEHWFPALHDGDTAGVPLFMHYTLGLAGEAGEVANVVKKLNRDGPTDDRMADLGAELADVLIYLLLLAGEVGIDLAGAYEAKRAVNVGRWGTPPTTPETPRA
jgi:hypothetical protein